MTQSLSLLYPLRILPHFRPPVLLKEIYWAAGFLDGEGSFAWINSPSHRGRERLTVNASQKYTPSLDRLQNIFGGQIYYLPHAKDPAHYAWRWGVYSRRAAAAMLTLYPLMSPYRQGQIFKAISEWKKRPWNGLFQPY